MLEINPVLSGKFSSPSYVPAAVNFTTGGVSRESSPTQQQAVSEVDSRRYTKFDRTATEAGSTTDFTFGDFLDLVNPLEHLPGISSVFRSLRGESIHPVSRVAGDLIYGGVLGLGSAVFGVVGAVADSVSEASNGQDATGLVVSAMLGETSPTPPASDAEPAYTPHLANVVDPSVSASAQALAAMIQPATPSVQAQDAPLPAAAGSGGDPALALAAQTHGKTYPLDRSKLPYGGVMAPVGATQKAQQALALSESSGAQRMGSTLYTGRFAQDGAHRPAVAAADTGRASEGVRNPIPQTLVDDLLAMRALQQYQNVAAGTGGGLAP